LRLVETETGRIIGAVSETVGSAVPVSALADRLSEGLLNKLNQLYPLRGKVLDSQDNNIRLNIGMQMGVSVGRQFKVVDAEAVLEVIAAEADASTAKVVKGETDFAEGMRVEAQ
jgi:hypothetical protein